MPTSTGSRILVDAGRTGVRIARLSGQRVVPVAEGPGLPMLAEPGGPHAAGHALASLLPRGEQIEVIAAGLTGLMEVPARTEEVAAALRRATGARRAVLTSDVVTSHLGALGGRTGVVAAVGTGTVVLGIGTEGRWAKVDGWGYLVGDAGSGYDIGRRGLAAALAAHDGRLTTRLQAAAEARFGPLAELPGWLYAQPEPVHIVASFSREVAEAARAGDLAALGIVDGAADAVEAAVRAALVRCQLRGSQRRVALTGSLGRLDLLQDRVRTRLARHDDPVTVTEAGGDALAGAALLLSEPQPWLDRLIHVSG